MLTSEIGVAQGSMVYNEDSGLPTEDFLLSRREFETRLNVSSLDNRFPDEDWCSASNIVAEMTVVCPG